MHSPPQPRFGDTTGLSSFRAARISSRSRLRTDAIRRLRSPDEHPFTPKDQLPAAILPPLEYPPLLYDPTGLNVNARIMDFYTRQIVPAITRVVTEKLGKQDDDGNYGSAATRDLEALQAISRRIHYGAPRGAVLTRAKSKLSDLERTYRPTPRQACSSRNPSSAPPPPTLSLTS